MYSMKGIGMCVYTAIHNIYKHKQGIQDSLCEDTIYFQSLAST